MWCSDTSGESCPCVDSHKTGCQWDGKRAIICHTVVEEVTFLWEKTKEALWVRGKPSGSQQLQMTSFRRVQREWRSVGPQSILLVSQVKTRSKTCFGPVSSNVFFSKTKVKIQFSLQYPVAREICSEIRDLTKIRPQNYDVLSKLRSLDMLHVQLSWEFMKSSQHKFPLFCVTQHNVFQYTDPVCMYIYIFLTWYQVMNTLGVF